MPLNVKRVVPVLRVEAVKAFLPVLPTFPIVGTVPDVIIARSLGFKAFDLLEFTEKEKADVDMKLLFT